MRPGGGIAGLAGVLAILAGGGAHAQAAPEEGVKAAFITKFPAFVVWPRPPARHVICTVGEDAVVLGLVSMNPAGAELRRLETIGPASGCTVLYAAGGPRQSVAQALQAVDGQPVLTVTDSRGSSVRGMIHFTVQRQRVRFMIDSARAQRHGLSISSKLLALAVGVDR
jgi:hypothetical protein